MTILAWPVAKQLDASSRVAPPNRCTSNGIGARRGKTARSKNGDGLKTPGCIFQNLRTERSKRRVGNSHLTAISSITGMAIPRQTRPRGRRKRLWRMRRAFNQHGCCGITSTYEIMRPRTSGSHAAHLGAGQGTAGRQPLRERVQPLGFETDDSEFNRVFEEFKALGRTARKSLFDGDIEKRWCSSTERQCAGPLGACLRVDYRGQQAAHTGEGLRPVWALPWPRLIERSAARGRVPWMRPQSHRSPTGIRRGRLRQV